MDAILKGSNYDEIMTEDITIVLNSNATVVATPITEDMVTNKGLQKSCDNAKEGDILLLEEK